MPEFRYKAVLHEGECVRGVNFEAWWRGWQTVRSRLDSVRLGVSRTSVTDVTMTLFFEAKKEILV